MLRNWLRRTTLFFTIITASEIVAIQEVLGLSPQGAFDTVSERISALETSAVGAEIFVGSAVPSDSLGSADILSS